MAGTQASEELPEFLSSQDFVNLDPSTDLIYNLAKSLIFPLGCLSLNMCQALCLEYIEIILCYPHINLKKFFLIYFRIYFWPCWVIVAVCGLSLVRSMELLSSCGVKVSHCSGFSCWGVQALGTQASIAVAPRLQSIGSIIVAHRLRCSVAYRIFPNQGSNPCLLLWQADSLPLSHGSPCACLLSHPLCPTLCDPRDYRHRAPLSLGFFRQEYWSGCPFPPPGTLPDPGIELMSPVSSALGRQILYCLRHHGSPHKNLISRFSKFRKVRVRC